MLGRTREGQHAPDHARLIRAILRGRSVSDSGFVVDYFRLSADRRLIFGGGHYFLP